MEPAFDPQNTAHLDLSVQEIVPDIKLDAEKCVLCFQPVYELETGRVMHNEALVRWQNPQGELKPPQAFLAQLEAANLLGELDRLVVDKAIAILREQRSVVLSINLSAVTIGDPTFITYLQSRLTTAGIDPKRLGLELPETLIHPQDTAAIAWLQDLRRLGCWVTLDSCTGQRFSLQEWQFLPVDRVKLDRQLVAQFDQRDTQNLAIALVRTNQLFKRFCIAKGIDNQNLLSVARRLGVQGVQGYYLRTPQRQPHLFLSISLLGTGFVSFLVLLYILKSLLGINLVPQEHAWQVIWHHVVAPLLDKATDSVPAASPSPDRPPSKSPVPATD